MHELSDAPAEAGRHEVESPLCAPGECYASPIVRELMDWFIGRGWPPVQAAGIVANLKADSDLCHEAVGECGAAGSPPAAQNQPQGNTAPTASGSTPATHMPITSGNVTFSTAIDDSNIDSATFIQQYVLRLAP